MRSMRRMCQCGFTMVLALAFGSLPVAAADCAVQAFQPEFSDLRWLSGGRSSGSVTSTTTNRCAPDASKIVCQNPFPPSGCPDCLCCKETQGTPCDPGPHGSEKMCVAWDNCIYLCECHGVWMCAEF